MKIDFKKIDFRQGKYWFPLVLFVPLVAIAYFSCEMFKGPTEQTGMVTDSINTMMPEPAGDGLHGKFAAMEDNILRGDGYTAINALGEEEQGESDDENVYSESEMDRIDKEKAEKKRQEQEMAALQQQLKESIQVMAVMAVSSGRWSSLRSRCARSRSEAGRWHVTSLVMTILQGMVSRYSPI